MVFKYIKINVCMLYITNADTFIYMYGLYYICSKPT